MLEQRHYDPLRTLLYAEPLKMCQYLYFNFSDAAGLSVSIIQHHMPLYLLSSNMDQCLALTSAVTALPAVSLPTDDEGDWRSGLATNLIRTGELRRTKTDTTFGRTEGRWGADIETAPFTSDTRRDDPRQ